MLAIISTLDRWAESWLKAMGAAFWQSIVLIAIATLLVWCLRRSSPAVRYWLWQIVAIKLLLMPFWTFAVPLPTWWKSSSPAATETISPAASQGHGSGVETPRQLIPVGEGTGQGDSPQVDSPAGNPLASITWQAWLLLAWLAVILWQIVRLIVQRVRLSRLLNEGVPASGELAALVGELAGQIGLRRAPATVSVGGDCPLFVCGLWRPVLVLPTRLLASLDPAERRQVILHELGHVKRHDLPLGWPIEIARIIYFFHPLVYWAAYQLRLERELACDQLAMAHSGHPPADYARTLVQVVSHASAPPASSVAAISAGLTGNQTAPKQPSQPNDS